MLRRSIPVCVLVVAFLPAIVIADDLTEIIQKDLISLGFDPGNIQGELTTGTLVEISKFQAEKSPDVTGEVTPQLLGVLAAEVDS